jgi:hypothetical protein
MERKTILELVVVIFVIVLIVCLTGKFYLAKGDPDVGLLALGIILTAFLGGSSMINSLFESAEVKELKKANSLKEQEIELLRQPDEQLSVTLRHDPPTSISLDGGDIRLLFDYRNNRESGKIEMLYYNTYVLFNGNLLQDSMLRDNLQIVVPPMKPDIYEGWGAKKMPGCYGMIVPGTYKFILIIIYAVGNKTFITHDIHSVKVVP